MKSSTYSRGKSLFFLVLSVACLLFAIPGTAQAQVEGCNPRVLDAMQKISQARVAQAVASDEAIYGKPDNSAAVTCQNQAAGSSASKAGAIFSGDFTSQLAPVIEEALTGLYSNFDDAEGNDSGSVDYTAAATQLSATYNCTGIDDLWKNFKGQGIKQGIPVALFANLVGGGAAPSGFLDPDFQAAWDAARTAQSVFGDAQAAFGAMPTITAIPPPPPANASACDVLVAFGAIPGPC